MSDVENIAREEEQVLKAPDTLGGSDLGQCKAHPALHCISEQKCNSNDTSEHLLFNVSNGKSASPGIGIQPTQQAINVPVPMVFCQSH